MCEGGKEKERKRKKNSFRRREGGGGRRDGGGFGLFYDGCRIVSTLNCSIRPNEFEVEKIFGEGKKEGRPRKDGGGGEKARNENRAEFSLPKPFLHSRSQRW